METKVEVRLDDSEKMLWIACAKKEGMSVSAWVREHMRKIANRPKGEGQVPIKPGVEVEVEPVSAPAKGKVKEYDPNGPEVAGEPVVGATGSKHRPYDPDGGEVVIEPLPGVKPIDKKNGVANVKGVMPPARLARHQHHSQCTCYMCKPPKELAKEMEKAIPVIKGDKMNSAGKMYTGEKVTYAGKPAWVVRDVNGRESMTFEAPPEG